MQEIVSLAIIGFISEIIGTIGGFGSSLFFVPLASFFLDLPTVLGITAFFHVFSNVSKIALFRKGFDKKLVIQMGIPAVLFVIVGAFLSKYVNGDWMELILAIFLIIISLVLMMTHLIQITANAKNAVVGGAMTGFVAGLIGTGGAIRGIVLSVFNLKPEIFVATSAFIDLGIDFSRSVVYAANGYVKWDVLYLLPILVSVSFFGTWIGKKVLLKIPQERFKYVVLGLILSTGIVTIVKEIFF